MTPGFCPRGVTAAAVPQFMIGQVVGNYRLVQKVGEGGMGAVYEAVREDIGVRAAIKVLHRDLALNPEMASRFFNEARASNMVQHPAIVRVFDYGTTETGTAYLAMEFLDGESLRSRLIRMQRFPEAAVIQIGRQIASALAAAHVKGIIHRDQSQISKVCFHVGHKRPQRRRNEPCPLTKAAPPKNATIETH